MKTELKKALAGRTKVYLKDTGRVPSAVLVPLYEDGGLWHIIFIRRTLTVATHQGQISFPGGARESGDRTLRDTALRESWEEIGLRREDAEVLGELDDELTKTSSYVVTPFVAAMPWPYRFTLEAREVAEVFAVPVPDLLAMAPPAPVNEMVDGRPAISYNYHYQGRVIFGATARILYKLLDIMRAFPETGAEDVESRSRL
jgi:8-oxo-dGTP pyrophosphatase MutT (NUDIX family)